jgi:hypothetical protein
LRNSRIATGIVPLVIAKGVSPAKLLVDRRDPKFVRHAMLGIDDLFGTARYGHLSKWMVGASWPLTIGVSDYSRKGDDR